MWLAGARAYTLLATLLNSQRLAKYAFRFRYKARVIERKAAFHAVVTYNALVTIDHPKLHDVEASLGSTV